MRREDKEKAIELRKNGKSIREISNELNISKGSISVWVRDVVLTEEQKEELKSHKPIAKSLPKKILSDGTIVRTRLSKKRLEIGEEKWRLYQIERQKQKNNKWRKNNSKKYVYRQSDLKRKLIEYMGGKCVRCGYNKCIQSLDFHHINPKEKEFNISTFHCSFDKMKKESEKCILVCRNCHGEIHWEIYKKEKEERVKNLIG